MNLRDTSVKAGKIARAAWLYLPALFVGLRNRRMFDAVETHCEFIGYPRSGPSLIGALLNAHPDIALAHEVAALRHAFLGFSRRQIYSLILSNARRSAQQGEVLGGYVYNVPNQW